MISSLSGKLVDCEAFRDIGILGECLLISSLPGKASRMLVDIARLVKI